MRKSYRSIIIIFIYAAALLSFICISMSLLVLAGCSSTEQKASEIILPSAEVNSVAADSDSKDDMLYDAESIESKYQNLKTGYLQAADNGICFKAAEFDYDDKAILYVKKYIDDDFMQYGISENIEIYLIDFYEYTTKFKKVDFAFFRNNFENYLSRPYKVEIDDDKIQTIIEIYVP